MPLARVLNELRPGLWTWSAAHPSWTPDQGGPEGWEQPVRSYALDAGDCLVLFDPLVAASDVRTLADGRPVVVVLTCYWHRRSTTELVDALDAVVHAPAADIGELGIAAEPYAAGDDLPGDVEPLIAVDAGMAETERRQPATRLGHHPRGEEFADHPSRLRACPGSR